MRKIIDLVTEQTLPLQELEVDSQRTIHFSKENPPPPNMVLRAVINQLNKPDNKISIEKLIASYNQRYGLSHSLKTMAAAARSNDYIRMQFQQAIARSSHLT